MSKMIRQVVASSICLITHAKLRITEGKLTGTISGLTNVSFTVTPKSSAVGTDKKVWFKTTVTASDGAVYNIDSETQLYDMRGYHYFVTSCPIGDTH